MKTFLFKLRYVFRNVTRSPFRTLSLFLIIAMLSFILLVAFSIKDCLQVGFRMHEDFLQENIDIKVTYDTKTTSHIIDASKARKLDPYFEYLADFFNLSTIATNGEKQEVIDLYCGKSSSMSKILEQELPFLNYNDAIITDTLAQKLNVREGDTIDINVGDEIILYHVTKIVNEHSMFRNSTVLISKEYFLKKYANVALKIDLASIDSENIATTLFIKVKDNVDVNEMIKVLSGADFYPNSLIKDPRNYNELESNIGIVCGILYAVLLIFAVALILVMISIVNLRIKTFKMEVGVCETLGEKKSYVFKILTIEIFILALLGIVVAYFLTKYIYNTSISTLSHYIHFDYHFKPMQLIVAILFVLTICLFTIFNSLRQYNRMELVDLTNNRQFEKPAKTKLLIILSTLFASLSIINYFVFPYFLPLKITSLFGIIFILSFGVISVSLFVKLVCKIFKIDQIFDFTFKKHLASNKIKHNSLRILLICLFGTIICLCAIETIETEISDVMSTINIDTIFVNPNGVTDEMVAEFKCDPSVKHVSKGWFERRLSTQDKKNSFLMVFSCDYNEAKAFMNLEIANEFVDEIKNPDQHYIVLTNEFLLATPYEVGDKIKLSIGNKTEEYTILTQTKIAGMEFAYTNDYYFQNELNMIIINQDFSNENQVNNFREHVIAKYTKDMGYLFDAATFLKGLLIRADSIIKLIITVVAIILGCFIISIINNTILNFNEARKEIAILESLGISPFAMNLMIIKEIIISYVAIFIPLTLMSFLVLDYLPGLMLLLGYYVAVPKTPLTIFLGYLIGTLCFFISYIYYFLGAKKLNVAQELKR